MDGDENLKAEPAKAIAECEYLRGENAPLKLRVGETPDRRPRPEQPPWLVQEKAQSSATVTVDSRPKSKCPCSGICFEAGTTCTRSGGKEETVGRAIRRQGIRNGTRHLLLVEAEEIISHHQAVLTKRGSDQRSFAEEANHRSLSPANR